MRVDDPDAAAESLHDLARRFGGELRARSGTEVTVAVPAGRVHEYLDRARELGDMVGTGGSSEERGMRAADLQAALRSAQKSRRRLEALRPRTSGTKEGIQLERRIQEVNERIAKLESVLAGLERRTALVRVHVRLDHKAPPEPVPQTRLPFPWLHELSLGNLQSPPPPDPGRPGITSNVDMTAGLELHAMPDRPRGETSYAVAFAGHGRAAEADPVGFSAGWDFMVGAGEGFIWETTLMAGLGTAIGRVATIGLIGGISGDGWTTNIGGGPPARVPTGLVLPAELWVTLDAEEWARLSLFFQPRWVPTPDSRADGADLVDFADELRIGGAIVAPFSFDEELDDGGPRLGFTYTEQMGVKRYVGTFGVGWGLVRH